MQLGDQWHGDEAQSNISDESIKDLKSDRTQIIELGPIDLENMVPETKRGSLLDSEPGIMKPGVTKPK